MSDVSLYASQVRAEQSRPKSQNQHRFRHRRGQCRMNQLELDRNGAAEASGAWINARDEQEKGNPQAQWKQLHVELMGRSLEGKRHDEACVQHCEDRKTVMKLGRSVRVYV